MSAQLELRDIHLPPDPSWWPPAPGWWMLAALLGAAAFYLVRFVRRRRRARLRLQRLRLEFDAAAATPDPLQRVAAISQVLRRAARLKDPAAAALQGEAWLRFLDGDDEASGSSASHTAAEFSVGPGRILLDGPYRRSADVQRADALIAPARRRFESLIAAP